ncbi:MAG: tRNA dihydrouridine(20/20a) synthase DusA [Zetaproteobacteria bacterium]|nr:MAG: tRNA dihydrouridine(20/20a) synthase DusA [Zetaproteobacteria bacterium]
MNQVNNAISQISVAPMMDWTDRHCRYFHRLISPNALLYTEMVTTGALIHGDKSRFLRFDKAEHPIALQLGGSDANDLSACAKMGEDSGYDEINLNCGCPSDRVQKGKIGAILMKEPDTVATAIEAMIDAVNIPITVKCRIGIDEYDSFEFLNTFVETLEKAGCKTFIIHARKAWLQGLSPKENRTVPEINYQRVLAIKEAHPNINIAVNGDIKTVEEVQTHLKTLDSAMLGREAYQNPYILAELEQSIFQNTNIKSRTEIAREMVPYIEQQMQDFDTPVKSITRHMVGLFQGLPGAKKWRQLLSTLPHEKEANADVIERALEVF